ncbi:hypothetical protein NQZ79_g2898 [Umbelopsis isabellina]|nr:hypothetical protein NQZ79_g2898 [Umbelopsis isabellina]
MAGISQEPTPPPPSRSSPRFQQKEGNKSSINEDVHQHKKEDHDPTSRPKAPIATRTRNALTNSATPQHMNRSVRHTEKASEGDGENIKTEENVRTEEDEDMDEILRLLPARKKAKLTAARRHASNQRRKAEVENGAGSPDSLPEDKKNNDNCETCGGVGEFLCCEDCPKAFHFVCVEPPMDAKDVANIKGKWFCNECRAKRRPPKPNSKILLGNLGYKLEASNPVLFELPKEIKQFFQGVSSNEYGEYVDSGSIKSVRKGKNGQPEEPDYYRLRDNDGGFILCYRCRKSALDDKQIIACDYCNLHWHLDCLDPPLASAPNTSRKWMCPNHAEMAMNLRKRQRRNPVIVEPDDPLNTPNHGDIQIVDDESDTKWQNDQLFKYAGVVYRIPESAVKLHFVDQIRTYGDICSLMGFNTWLTYSFEGSIRTDTDQWSRSQESQQPDTDSSSPSYGTLRSSNEDRRISNLKVANSTHPSAEESREASGNENSLWLEGLSALQADIANYLSEDLNSNNFSSDDSRLRMLIRAALGSNTDSKSKDEKVELDRATREGIAGISQK